LDIRGQSKECIAQLDKDKRIVFLPMKQLAAQS
jgi:hypothetical protein